MFVGEIKQGGCCDGVRRFCLRRVFVEMGVEVVVME
jgi:hypothetical protein